MTYFEIIKRLETFCNSHLQVKKFGADFLEQIGNFATQD